MKKYKIMFLLLVAVATFALPINIVKADENDIMPTAVVSYCPSCGNGTYSQTGLRYGDTWFDDDAVPCTHGLANHYDVPQWRQVWKVYTCSNCGYTGVSYYYSQWRYVKCYSY